MRTPIIPEPSRTPVSSPPSSRTVVRARRAACLLALAVLALTGCARVGLLKIQPQTVAPVETRRAPGSQEELQERGGGGFGPLFGGDTLLGFIPGTADSSRRYLGRLRGGYTVDTLNIMLYGDNRPGYRTSRLSNDLDRMKGGLSLNPVKFLKALVTVPLVLIKGTFPDFILWRDIPALVTHNPTWGREQSVVNAMLARIDSVQAHGQAVSAVINTGDLVKNGRVPAHWMRFLRIIKPLSSRVPYFPVAGNHERTDTREGVENWRTATGLPVGGDRLYYCFDTADGWVRFIAIDTNPIVDPQNRWTKDLHVTYSKEQFDWLTERVREHNGPAVIMMHHPPFSAGFHRVEWQADSIMQRRRETMVRALHETGISVIASGHEHAYERALMTWPDAVMVVIATGGAGAPLTQLPPNPASADLFSQYNVAGGTIKKDNVLTAVAFHYIHLRLWFGGGEFYTYAVEKDGSSKLIDKVQIDLKRYGIPQIDQHKVPIPPQKGPSTPSKEGEKPGQTVAAKADTAASSQKILTTPPPSTSPPQKTTKKKPVRKKAPTRG